MKTIVIYKSKTGYTKTYAEWIAEELNCDIKSAETVSKEDFKQYDVIIYGGGLYALGINGISLIKKNYEELKNKKIVVWATGSNPGRPDEMESVWKHNFTPEQLSTIKTFYLRGGFDYKLLKTGSKILISMMKKFLEVKKHRTEDEQGLLEAYSIPEYHCDQKNTKELIEYVRGL